MLSLSSYETCTPWISNFCNQRSNKFFCEVNKNYIADTFNLCGLDEHIPGPSYLKALNIILDNSSEFSKNLELEAKKVYGLIHARYILTNEGSTKMLDKFAAHHFGFCPRVFCNSQSMLPIGTSDLPGVDSVKLFCPQCRDVYKPTKCVRIDGAYFGIGFPHLLFMMHPKYRPKALKKYYVPRLFGFKIHSQAYILQEDASTE